MRNKLLAIVLLTAGLAAVALAGRGTLTVTNVVDNGDATYDVTVTSVAGITTNDHFGILNSTSGGIYSIQSIDPVTLVLTLNDTLSGAEDANFGAPDATLPASAWYATPTSGELPLPPYTGPGWGAALRYEAAAINSLLPTQIPLPVAEGGTGAADAATARTNLATASTSHNDTHATGGSDAFDSSDILESVTKRLQTTTGPTTLTVGAVADGELLIRSGTAVIGSTSPLVVEEADSSPSVAGVTKILVDNGKLTDDTGGQITLDLSGTADGDTLGGLAFTDGNFAVGNGSAWVAESGATARASLGVDVASLISETMTVKDQWGSSMPQYHSTTPGMDSMGILSSQASGSSADGLSFGASSNGSGPRLQLQSNAASGRNSYYSWETQTRGDYKPLVLFRVAHTRSDIRAFAGLGSTVNVSASDNPAIHYVGLEKHQSDTNFFFVANDGGSEDRFDSGVAFLEDDDYQVLIDWTADEACEVFLLDSDGALLASQAFTTELPPSTTDLKVLVSGDEITGSGALQIEIWSVHMIYRR